MSHLSSLEALGSTMGSDILQKADFYIKHFKCHMQKIWIQHAWKVLRSILSRPNFYLFLVIYFRLKLGKKTFISVLYPPSSRCLALEPFLAMILRLGDCFMRAFEDLHRLFR